MRYRPMAAPAFARRWFGDGVGADALAHAPVVVFDRDDPLQHAYLASRTEPGAAPPLHMVPRRLTSSPRSASGWAGAWSPTCRRRRGAPALTEIDPTGTTDVALHWQQWRLRSASLDRLAEASSPAPAAPDRASGARVGVHLRS